MEQLSAPLTFWMLYGTGNNRRYININKIYDTLGSVKCSGLPAFHALTGCDYNPAFYQKGKRKPWALYSENEQYQKAFTALQDPRSGNYENAFDTLEDFACKLYATVKNGVKNCSNVDEARLKIFSSTYTTNIEPTDEFKQKLKDFDAYTLPPCKRELKQQLLRASYIGHMWKNTFSPVPNETLNILEFGWKLEDDIYPFQWFEGEDVPSNIQEIIEGLQNISRKNMSDITLDYDFKAENLIACGRTTKEAIGEVRNWILSLQDEYVPRTLQDEIIVLFLLSCDNDVALSKKTIINFYSLKKHAPELHDNRDPLRNDIKLALEIVHMSSIPIRTNDNSVIHYFHIHDTNYKKFELIPILKLTYMLIDISQEKNPPDGLIVVLDLKGITLMHFLKIKVWVLKKYLQFLEEGMTMKIKSIHILNSAYFIDKLMAIVKSMVKNEFLNKIHIHQSDLEQEVLFQLIPKKCLPKEYGGDLPSKYELHQKTIEQFKRKQYFWNAEEQLRKSAHRE